VKYFFDNCISFRFARMLAALDIEATALRDRYPQNISDIALFEKLRESEEVFVTSDRSQLTRIQEARALKEAGVTAIFFGPYWSKMDQWQQAKWIITRREIIDGFVRGVTRGTCAEIKQNGKANPLAL